MRRGPKTSFGLIFLGLSWNCGNFSVGVRGEQDATEKLANEYDEALDAIKNSPNAKDGLLLDDPKVVKEVSEVIDAFKDLKPSDSETPEEQDAVRETQEAVKATEDFQNNPTAENEAKVGVEMGEAVNALAHLEEQEIKKIVENEKDPKMKELTTELGKKATDLLEVVRKAVNSKSEEHHREMVNKLADLLEFAFKDLGISPEALHIGEIENSFRFLLESVTVSPQFRERVTKKLHDSLNDLLTGIKADDRAAIEKAKKDITSATTSIYRYSSKRSKNATRRADV